MYIRSWKQLDSQGPKEPGMIVIVVEQGLVQAVYSDEPQEDVKVLDLDHANAPDADASPKQLRREIKQVEREMHRVL